jgi:uncharacterized protein
MDAQQVLGLGTGLLFGFLLQKGRVVRFEKQVGAMLLQDMTILKFMMSAMLVGMVGIYALSDAGMITLSHKALNVGAVTIGAILFGIGWAAMGYCPGTSLGALGEGRLHSVFAIAGMIAGAALYARAYPLLKASLLAWYDAGTITVPGIFGVSHWTVIALFWIFTLFIFVWFERKGL